MSTDTLEIKDEDVLNEYMNLPYGHMNRLIERWKGRVYFLDSGKARLGAVLGYIVGMVHAGQKEFAAELAANFDRNMGQLSFKHNDYEFKVTEEQDGEQIERTVKVPNRKCLLGDDGTWHGFGLMWYRVLRPEVYEEKLAQFQAEIGLERADGAVVYDTAHNRVVKALDIRERLDFSSAYSEELTEHRFVGNTFHKFYYVPSHNGGLIYHGPGHGETFSVNISSGRTLWGIHT